MLFVWGRNSDGQCGKDRQLVGPKATVPLPCPIELPKKVAGVACGTGQQGCTFAVLEDGSVFSFGSDSGGRLGHPRDQGAKRGGSQPNPIPRKVEALASVHVKQVACSEAHALCVTEDGSLYSWGRQGRTGCLGRPEVGPNEQALPAAVQLLPGPAKLCDCESGVSGAVLRDGRLVMFGRNDFGRLGLGDGADVLKKPVPTPMVVPLPKGCGAVTALSLGSLYSGCICIAGSGGSDNGGGGGGGGAGSIVLTWGYGGHGNLGHGDRSDRYSPTRIAGEGAFVAEASFCSIACTKGQEGVKGGLYPSAGGTEGPHTVVISGSGQLYTFGTCHKGLLCNLGAKTGAFGDDFDELLPYCVGSTPPRNASMPKADPISPYACWPFERYVAEPGPLTAAVSGHIHAAAIGTDGRLWAWGCGSNDGRCGVERFLNMAGEGKPPRVDAMKCYLMGPHRVGIARPLYWPYGPSLDGVCVTAVATGRTHMACIGIEGKGVPAAVVHQGILAKAAPAPNAPS